MVALIASDLDGTLLRSDGQVGERTKTALEQVEDAGFVVVLVTGRPPRWMKPITEQIPHRGLAICANGGILMDLETSDVIRADAFEDGLGMEVLQELRRAMPELVFGVEWADGFAHERTYPKGVRRSELARGAAQDVATVEGLFERPVIKLLARAPDGRVEGMIERAEELVGEVATVTHSSIGLLEISAPGVTKAMALERLAAHRNLDAAEVLAFGDMPNDRPMLVWAGHSVAVANAHPVIIEVADEVTASNDEEGVAQVLERLLDD